MRNRTFLAGFLLFLLGVIFIYREAIFSGKIIFPSNLLAANYSPWSTHQFAGWGQGIPNKPIGGNDQVRLFYPGRTFSNSQIQQGILPTWNPYIFSGSPHLANFQSAVLYPLNVLYFILPQITAWSMLVVAPFIIGFVGMYLYLLSLKLEKIAALFGAVAFGLCGFLATWTQENAAMGQSACWLPLILFSIEKLILTKKKLYLFFLIFTLASSFLGGFYQITFYIYVVALIYGFFRIIHQTQKKLLRFLLLTAGFLFSLSLVGLQLLPSAEAFFASARSSSSIGYLFDSYLLPATHLLHALIPDVYGNPGTYTYFGKGFYHETIVYIGVLPLLFAFFASISFFKNKLVQFFMILAAISFFLTVKSPVTIWLFSLPIPIINTFLPSRILFITSSALSVLAAFGISNFLNQTKKHVRFLLLLICLGFLILALSPLFIILPSYFTTANIFDKVRNYLLWHDQLLALWQVKIMTKSMIVPIGMLTALFILLILPIKRISLVILLFIFTLLGQFYFLQKYAVVGYPQFLYPQHPVFSFLQEKAYEYRFLAFGRPILGNVATDKKLYTPEGIDAVFPTRYGQLAWAAKNDGKIISDIPRIEVTLSNLQPEESILHNQKRLRLISLLGVKYIFFYLEEPVKGKDLSAKFPASQFVPLWNNENWYAFEYKNALPRVYFANKYIVKQNPQEIVDAFFDPSFDPTHTIIIEEPLSADIELSQNPDPTDTATITKYAATHITVKTETSQNQLLFLSDNYFPGWQAYIDGKPSKLYRANYTFRAVLVPSGSHTVTFSYEPETVRIGGYITLITLVLLVILLLLKPQRKQGAHERT